MGHIKECKNCSEEMDFINQVMGVLDEKVDIPDYLVSKVLQKNSSIEYPVQPKTDFGKYLQLAAVIAAGIFLGIVLGENANPDLLASKKVKKDKALLEYLESHHLGNESSFYRF